MQAAMMRIAKKCCRLMVRKHSLFIEPQLIRRTDNVQWALVSAAVSQETSPFPPERGGRSWMKLRDKPREHCRRCDYLQDADEVRIEDAAVAAVAAGRM